LPDRIPEAIEETLLEVCFGELFLAPDAAALLFDPLVFALALFVVEGFAALLLVVVDRVPLLFAAAGLALLLGAAARAPPLLVLDDAAFAPPLFAPREPAVPPPVLPAIFQLPCFASLPHLARQTCRDGRLWQAEVMQRARAAEKFGAGNLEVNDRRHLMAR
jgi:hypothetical protein